LFTNLFGNSLQESHAVAGKPRDAAVIFSNTINKDPWRMDVKLSYVTYLIYKSITCMLNYFYALTCCGVDKYCSGG